MRAPTSFICDCGCLDEVRQPAPETVGCWGCKRQMRRWTPRFTPPEHAGRDTTDKEKAAMGHPTAASPAEQGALF